MRAGRHTSPRRRIEADGDGHPLDNVVWSALTQRQGDIAVVHGRARRYDRSYGMFAAVADRSSESLADLAALITAHGEIATVEADPTPTPAGVVVVSRDRVLQMTAERVVGGPVAAIPPEHLQDADGPEMLELATLTRPGPFFERTHLLGGFRGFRIDGRLVAMAGERMKPEGFTEVSGVCTHPDHRGRGYAATLIRIVTSTILARGDRPFLHTHASNVDAIALYETLGFTVRREVTMTRMRIGPTPW